MSYFHRYHVRVVLKYKVIMKLIVVNSNSQGNSYVLEASNGQQLCIEAGRPLLEVKKVANLKTSKCVGVIISHSHG